MVEIVFSDSACGSLKMAQRYGEGNYLFGSGSIGVMIHHTDGRKPTKEEIETAQREAEKQQRSAWENAVPMGGNPADVYGFDLALCVGDISENIPAQRRQQVLEWLWSIYPGDVWKKTAQELLQRANRNLAAVLSRVSAGESVRIWYSNQPDEMCGLYWFMAQINQLESHGGQVFLVRLPEWEAGAEGGIVQKSGWGEVAPGEWSRYSALQKTAPSGFLQSCAAHWNTLQKENAPLRAVLNGRLVSAPETLYDVFITREIAAAEEEFQEAMVVGRVLGKYQLGIGDAWVALRIEEMIRHGLLEPLHDPAADSPIYHRMLKKCAKL